jgi:hypothetical protein
MSEIKFPTTALGLANITPEGDIPESRLKDSNVAYQIYAQLRDGDQTASVNRSKVDAMYNGRPPFDSAYLRSIGQGHRSNLSFGEAEADLEATMVSYTDLINSVDYLIKCTIDTDRYSPEEIERLSNIFAEEFTRLYRQDWPDFFFRFQLLCKEFVKHGVAFTYFEDEFTWKWNVSGWNNFLLPKMTKASDDSVEVAIALREYLPHELYQFIKDPEAAKECGWNIECVRNAITKACVNEVTESWETIESRLKNNELYYSYAKSAVIRVCHYFVREFDGSYSHHIGTRDFASPDYLYSKLCRFKNANQAFVSFCYGIGDGFFHSIRGQGFKIYDHIITSQQLQNALIDGAKLGTAVGIKPINGQNAGDLTIAYSGPLVIFPENCEVVQTNIPNIAERTIPVVNYLAQMRSNNTGTYQSRAMNPDGQARSATEAQLQAANSSILSTGAMNLFYTPFEKLLTECIRRLNGDWWTAKDQGGREVFNFRKRLAKRGFDLDLLSKITNIRAVRSFGAGSISRRIQLQQAILSLAGSFDETGKKRALYDLVTQYAGTDYADKYVGTEVPRTPDGVKIAMLENAEFEKGSQIAVLPDEPHVIHLGQHLQVAGQILQGIDQGQVDPRQVYQLLKALYVHSEGHYQYMKQDSIRQVETAQFGKIINLMREAVVSIENSLAKEQRAMQANAQESQQQPQADPKLAMKMQEHAFKMQAEQEKLGQQLQADNLRLQQELKAKDLQLAQSLQQSQIQSK